MRTILAQPLTKDRFSPYGAFADLLQPEGFKLGDPAAEFFPDLLRVFPGAAMAGLSVVRTVHRPWVVDTAEQHDLATEILLPLDGDIICFVAPPCAAFPAAQTEAFLVPRGTAIAVKPGVWHKAPFPAAPQTVHTLVLLPERTYAVDCRVQTPAAEERIEILL